ncbi:MAG: DUF4124 domain-containing protein [Pseudomonas sp.]
MRLLFTCLLLALTLPASAQIYTYTDATGNRIYTDRPPLGTDAQAVELPALNTVESVEENTRRLSPPADNPGTHAAVYRLLQIDGLPSGQALRANNGSFSVTVMLEPALQPGHQLRLLLDGQPYGEPSRGPHLQLTNIDRGTHQLAVQVLSAGQPIQQSPPQEFTLQRVSVHNRALRPAPKPSAPSTP